MFGWFSRRVRPLAVHFLPPFVLSHQPTLPQDSQSEASQALQLAGSPKGLAAFQHILGPPFLWCDFRHPRPFQPQLQAQPNGDRPGK